VPWDPDEPHAVSQAQTERASTLKAILFMEGRVKHLTCLGRRRGDGPDRVERAPTFQGRHQESEARRALAVRPGPLR